MLFPLQVNSESLNRRRIQKLTLKYLNVFIVGKQRFHETVKFISRRRCIFQIAISERSTNIICNPDEIIIPHFLWVILVFGQPETNLWITDNRFPIGENMEINIDKFMNEWRVFRIQNFTVSGRHCWCRGSGWRSGIGIQCGISLVIQQFISIRKPSYSWNVNMRGYFMHQESNYWCNEKNISHHFQFWLFVVEILKDHI